MGLLLSKKDNLHKKEKLTEKDSKYIKKLRRNRCLIKKMRVVIIYRVCMYCLELVKNSKPRIKWIR